MTDHTESTPHPKPHATLGAKATVGLIALAIISALTVLLVIQNFQTITIRLFQVDIRLRLGWALVAAAVFGGGFCVLLSRLFHRR